MNTNYGEILKLEMLFLDHLPRVKRLRQAYKVAQKKGDIGRMKKIKDEAEKLCQKRCLPLHFDGCFKLIQSILPTCPQLSLFPILD
ncbi:MAG: hypothetical protein LWW94_09110 [Candidatus Desulfofervidaceae bacterium]|nr:hypothetical protein [Candidatus Desulfofervidaceae bacterium]